MMNVLCNGCGMCCRIIPVCQRNNVMVRDGLQPIDESFLSGLVRLPNDEAEKLNIEYVNKIRDIFPDAVFYSCKYISENNECTMEKKPSVCYSFPSSPLAIVPDECGSLGEVFMKNEELKRKIRMIKEEILDYETLIDRGDKDSESYKKIIENLKRFITKYKEYGSENW